MKALVLYGPGDYRVESSWKDPVVRPGWARIRVSHAGICGSDLPRFGSKGSYRHPVILGHEFAGTIETPAPGSACYRGGERVAVLPVVPCGECDGCLNRGPFHCKSYGFLGSRDDGGFAEFCLVPESNLFPLPDGVDNRFGALIEPLAVALHAVRRSSFSRGATALVFGAGPIGLLTGLWLRMLGAAHIMIADVREPSVAIARKLGFEEVINTTSDPLAALTECDFAFEAAGSQQALRQAIDVTGRTGTVTIVGRDTRDTVIPLEQFERLMRKELTLRGCWGYDLRGDEELVRQFLSKRTFPLEALITHQVGLEAAPSVIWQMVDRRLSYCKVMIEMEKTG